VSESENWNYTSKIRYIAHIGSVWEIKQRMMRREGNLEIMGGDKTCKQGIFLKNLRKRDNMEDEGIYRKIILKWILKIPIWRAWTGLVQLRTRTDNGLL
jgi:hypothetical protein